MNLHLNHTPRFFVASAALIGLALVLYFAIPVFLPLVYENNELTSGTGLIKPKEPETFLATHIPAPSYVRAIYMTSWVAGTPMWRKNMIKLIEDTELNALVIDIKDYSGRISFPVSDNLLKKYGASERRIRDIRGIIADLHKKGIYVIGRITVFQDPYLARAEPLWAIKKGSATSTIWTDYKGLAFIDPGARKAWDYITALSRESYEVGFDELNFDYVRFPSDGDMFDIFYPFSESRISADEELGKAKIMREFFQYLNSTLKDPLFYESNKITGKRNVPMLSADLFGMTTTNTDDLNIGQILEYTEPYFDFLAPMVYPSHYPNGFIGYAKPATVPYEVVKYSLERGAARLTAASSTPLKLRPWLQDFDLGATYDAAMVREQIQATYDVGLTSWMLWDAANTYTRGALLPSKK